MNFNFNFKDMLAAARASMWDLTNGCDSHHAEKYRIKPAGGSGLAEPVAVQLSGIGKS